MHTIFEIDIIKANSEVAILVNGNKSMVTLYLIDAVVFSRQLKDLNTVSTPEIIFEATGVYSRQLQAFLEENDYIYTP